MAPSPSNDEERVSAGFEAALNAVQYLSIGKIDGPSRHDAIQGLCKLHRAVIAAMREWRKDDGA